MILNIKKFSTFFFLLFISINSLIGNTSEYFKRYRISLLTYDQGTELYSIFGHSAIRVIDDSLHQDYVYNYGTFSSNNSTFYIDFLKGRLPYRLSKAPTRYVIKHNLKEGRRLIENSFLLNKTETKKLIGILEVNYLPHNREYYYDFFYDNCATRILQVIDTATNFKLNKSYHNYIPISFRKHTNIYLKTKSWIRLGINFLMGFLSDMKTTGEETAFLPDHLQAILLENPEILETFQSFTSSEQKAYLDWIYTAKKDDTKAERISVMMKRLEKGLKRF